MLPTPGLPRTQAPLPRPETVVDPPATNAPARSHEVRQRAVTPVQRQINVGEQDGQPAASSGDCRHDRVGSGRGSRITTAVSDDRRAA